ncbi:MAG: hypothetical protein JWP17_2952 [Solirubrobacterales bacterium]|nr:hypothetical protein [Solirubrobacterales bacterium]
MFPAAGATAASSSCALEGGRTVLQSDAVRIYRVSVGSGRHRHQQTAACALGRTGRFTLPNGWHYSTAGRFIAGSQQVNTDTGDSYGFIRLYDANGRRLLRSIDVGGFGDARLLSFPLLSAQGSLAWVESVYNASMSAFTSHEIHESSNAAEDIVVDGSPDIDPTSLAAAAHSLYWQRAGQISSAPWS